MPKINRKYYARAKEIADASINIVESNHDFLSLNINTSLISSTSESSVRERNELVNTYSNKKLDKNLLQTYIVHSDNYEVINNETLDSENDDGEDIFINEDGAINHNFLDNFEHHENDNISFTSKLQGWAIRN